MPVQVSEYEIALVSRGREIPAFNLVQGNAHEIACSVASVADQVSSYIEFIE